MPDFDVSMPLDTDYYDVFGDDPVADRAFWDHARTFAAGSLDEVTAAWDKAGYPPRLMRRLGELDLLTDGVVGPGLTEMSPLAAGLVNMLLAQGDGATATKGNQRREKMDRVRFGRRRDGRLGPRRRGQCSRLPGGAGPPGYHGETNTGKGSLRAIHQARITLTDVRVPPGAVLPDTLSFKDASTVLFATRLGVAGEVSQHSGGAGDRFDGARHARWQRRPARNHVIQHLADIESMHTYEGTESVQSFLIGRDLTGISAFR